MLELPRDCIVNLVFHVSQLKGTSGASASLTIAPPVTAKLELDAQSLNVIEMRLSPSGAKEILVLWEGLDPTNVIWVDWSTFFAT